MRIHGSPGVTSQSLLKHSYQSASPSPLRIVQVRDLIAAEDVDFTIDDLLAQRLEHAGGVALPLDVFELVVDAGE